MELSNNEVRHKKNLGVEFLEFTAFDAYPNILADFAIRGQANLDYNWSENNGNYIKLAMALGIDYDGIVKAPEQVHGDEAARVNSIMDTPNRVDALMTNVPGISLVMRVADCIAVLVYDPVNNAVANIHSGWRGTLLRIAPKTIRRMADEYGTKPEDVIVVLCPSIGPDHFEVTEDVRAQFEAEFGQSHIVQSDETHFLIDAPACLTDSLVEIGVQPQNVHSSGLCTVCHNNLIHSYRANTDDEKTCRNASIICIM